MIGIYKIKSPTGKIYIGQSRNIVVRWYYHRRYYHRQSDLPLSRSFKKYGVENHRFSMLKIFENVDQLTLDRFEKNYIKYFKENGKILLNVKEGGSKGKHSIDTKIKIGLGNRGKKYSKKSRELISKSLKEYYINNPKPPITDKQKNQISKANKNRIKSKRERNRISVGLKKYFKSLTNDSVS